MRWSRWASLDGGDWPKTCGIYRIRLCDPAGKPLAIHRWCGLDPAGVIYIGATVNVARRLAQFRRVAGGGSGLHSGARNYRGVVRRLRRGFEGHSLQASVCSTTTRRATSMAERAALEAYVARFAELPPLNRKHGRIN